MEKTTNLLHRLHISEFSRALFSVSLYRLCWLLFAGLVSADSVMAAQPNRFSVYHDKFPQGLENEIAKEPTTRLIVRYTDPAVDAEIQALDDRRQQNKDDQDRVTALKAKRYGELKVRTTAKLNRTRFKLERDYSHLPMNVVTVKGENGLLELLANPEVAEVYRDVKLRHFLTQSAPLIRATEVPSQTGYNGNNTMVVILDTGINYTLANFGSCSAPGVPASCRVQVAQDLATQDNALDDDGHGTNVSGIVAGIAQGTKLAVFDVFDGETAFSSVIIAGINWAIANKQTYHISSINMSFGDPSQNATLCASSASNPFVTPISNAHAAGILAVVAAGNSGFTAGLAIPACTPKAVSVGAVYDSNVGGLNWGVCTDNTTAADQVTCFSNSASYLSLLAPGALITAAGSTMGGTSQATPHVAAAIAILSSARPTETVTSTLNRLISTGVPVIDGRTGLTFPRIDVLTALGSVNDNFASNTILLGTTNQTITTVNIIASSQFASKEPFEPNHAGNSGGKSVWFEWTSPAVGIVSINTHGSSFDTLLAVYSGSSLSSLSVVASNDDDGSPDNNSSLSFVAAPGATFKIAVDGFNGTFGQIAMNLEFVADTSGPGAAVPASPLWALVILGLGLMAVSAAVKQSLVTRITQLSKGGGDNY